MYEILEFLFVKSQDSILTVQCHLDTTCISKLTQSSPYSDGIVRDKKKLKALLLQRVGVNLAKSLFQQCPVSFERFLVNCPSIWSKNC
jgi:hypothetical protein